MPLIMPYSSGRGVKMVANWLLALVVILALGISNVVSANFQSAYDAYRNGEYEQALTEWQAGQAG